MLAVFLALASSVCWGFGDLIAGLASRRAPSWSVSMVSQLAGLAAAFLVISALGREWPGWRPLAPAFLAGILLAVGMVAYFKALASGTMSVVAPIAATCAVVPVIVGLIDGERPGIWQLGGAAAALLGVMLASREPAARPVVGGTLEAAAPLGAQPVGVPREQGLSVVLALVAAVCFGAVLVGFARSAQYDALWPPLAGRISSVVVLGGIVVGSRGGLRLPRAALGGAVAAGLFHIAAATLYSVASTKGYLSLVAVLSSLSAVLIVAFGHLLLREHLAPHQWLGVVAALAGVVLITVG
jgi:drug/metabolite transporter (DMT)-like permease